MIIDKYGRGCTLDTQDPWRQRQAEILLDNILQHAAVWTLLNTIYTSFFQVTLWSPKWRSLNPWKGHLKPPKRSLGRSWHILHQLVLKFLSWIVFSGHLQMIRFAHPLTPAHFPLARVAQFPLYPNKNWGTSTYTTRNMWVELLRMSLPTRQKWRFLTTWNCQPFKIFKARWGQILLRVLGVFVLRKSSFRKSWSQKHTWKSTCSHARPKGGYEVVEKLAIYKYILIILHQLAEHYLTFRL